MSLLPNLSLITRNLPRFLTQTIRTVRSVATDIQSTVFDTFEVGKFTFAISQISILDVDKRACPMLDTQLFLRAQSLRLREQFFSYKDQSQLKIIYVGKYSLKQRLFCQV